MTLFEEFVARGLVEATTDPEIAKMLETPQTIYCGFDPSASSLQAGTGIRDPFDAVTVTSDFWPLFTPDSPVTAAVSFFPQTYTMIKAAIQ